VTAAAGDKVIYMRIWEENADRSPDWYSVAPQ
jgi:hypothetical protein